MINIRVVSTSSIDDIGAYDIKDALEQIGVEVDFVNIVKLSENQHAFAIDNHNRSKSQRSKSA